MDHMDAIHSPHFVNYGIDVQYILQKSKLKKLLMY